MKKILLCKTVGLDSSTIFNILNIGYEIKTASSMSEASTLLDTFKPDVVICGEIFCASKPAELSASAKKSCGAKILIILSTDTDCPYKTAENGGDDVIFSPFSACELITRIEMLCTEPNKFEAPLFRTGQMTIDFENCRVYISDKLLHLTMLEHKLLCTLAKNNGKAVSYASVMRELWQTPIGNEIRSLRVFVNAIRRKIRQLGDTNEYIITQTGAGYKIAIID